MNNILYIGHAKTGTSAIQSYLAINGTLLHEYGFNLPPWKTINLAKKGLSTIGNYREVFEISSLEPTYQHLFCSEALFTSLSSRDEQLLNFLEENIEKFSQVILVTRNIFDHMISSWGQEIKARNGTNSIDAVAKNYKFYTNIIKVINRLEGIGANVTVRHYDAMKHNLEYEFVKMTLGDLADEFYDRSEKFTFKVNRSLTPSELEFQRIVNTHIVDNRTKFLSDALTMLTDINSERPIISQQAYDHVYQNNYEAVCKVNTYLSPDEQINFDYSKIVEKIDDTEASYNFSRQQLEVMIEQICGFYNRKQRYFGFGELGTRIKKLIGRS